MDMQLSFVSALSLALAHSLWQLMLLGVLSALCLGVLRHSSAALRHVVGMGWLLAMVGAPVATFVHYWNPVNFATRTQPLHDVSAPPLMLPELARIFEPWGDDRLMWVTPLWLLGVVLMVLLNIGGGWRMLRRLDHAPYSDLPLEWQRRVQAMSAALGITRTIAVRLAASVGTPFTARMRRPVIWLPQALLAQLPVEQIKALLAHELAHIRRLDWLWNGIQCVIESLLFFHPALWWLSGRIRQDREHACDDLAAAVCGDGIALAEALATLARHGLTTPPLVLAAKGGPLMKRISHILSQPSTRTSWRAPAFLLLFLSSGMLFAMQAEPLKMLGQAQNAASGQRAVPALPPLAPLAAPTAPPPLPALTSLPAPPAAPALPALPRLVAPPAPPALPSMAPLAAPPAPPALPALARLAAPAAPPAAPAPAAEPAPPAPPAPPALPASAAPPT